MKIKIMWRLNIIILFLFISCKSIHYKKEAEASIFLEYLYHIEYSFNGDDKVEMTDDFNRSLFISRIENVM